MFDDIQQIQKFISLLVNKRTGIIRDIKPAINSFFPVELAVYYAIFSVKPKISPYNLNPLSISGAGKNKQEAMFACLGEALERYCVFYGRSWEKMIYDSYQKIGKKAVNPNKFSLFSNTQYKNPEFPFKPFDNKTDIYWIKGKKLTTKDEVYLPAFSCIFLRDLSNKKSISYSTTTGVACGSSYEEAATKAIYEIIERDAFMIMWLNKIRYPCLKLKFDKESWLSKTLYNLKLSNYRSYTYVLDNDMDIPTFATMTLNIKKQFPLVSFGAATSLNFNRAIEKSIIESLHCLNYLFSGDGLDNGLSKKKSVIKNFGDNAFLYRDPDRYENISFLVDTEKRREHVYKDECDYREGELNKVISLVGKRGYDIYLVDLTPDIFKQLGFCIIRAVIPEFIDLSVGDWILKGGKRIYDVPPKVGFKRKFEEEINTEYHPFP